ncbi:recombinase family protein [Pararhizobium sp. IMCC21322]|uniref:recombinase family protein n=1 Tax=Pararhizobium sp. IMCC21322 TaxID=3067903 RepID=UPI002740B6F1|nr:recombinase family protein [Pararhizobium sp. IMCC21322]
MIYGYLRISTKMQRPDRQIEGLKGLCDAFYVEVLSAVSAKRPIFEEIVQKLQCGDTFLVWDLDRVFRTTYDAIVYEKEFRRRGIKFKAMNMNIDTSTADGNHEYQSRAAAAEWERRKISERTIEGLVLARKRGSRLGRPPKITDEQVRHAKALIGSSDTSIKDAAASLKVHPWTLSRRMRALPPERTLHQ